MFRQLVVLGSGHEAGVELFFCQAADGIPGGGRSRGLGGVYKGREFDEQRSFPRHIFREIQRDYAILNGLTMYDTAG